MVNYRADKPAYRNRSAALCCELRNLDWLRGDSHHEIEDVAVGGSATLEAYHLDLRQWVGWLDAAGLGVFVVERAHIEHYAH